MKRQKPKFVYGEESIVSGKTYGLQRKRNIHPTKLIEAYEVGEDDKIVGKFTIEKAITFLGLSNMPEAAKQAVLGFWCKHRKVRKQGKYLFVNASPALQ